MVLSVFAGEQYLNFWISSNNRVSILFRHHLKRSNEAKWLTKYEDQVDNYLFQAGNINNMWTLLVSTLRFETNGDNCVKSFIVPARAKMSKLYFWLPIEEKRPPFAENPLPALNHEHTQQNWCDLCIDWSTIGHCFTLFFVQQLQVFLWLCVGRVRTIISSKRALLSILDDSSMHMYCTCRFRNLVSRIFDPIIADIGYP